MSVERHYRRGAGIGKDCDPEASDAQDAGNEGIAKLFDLVVSGIDEA